MISFALESPGFESHADILSLFCQLFFYIVSIRHFQLNPIPNLNTDKILYFTGIFSKL